MAPTNELQHIKIKKWSKLFMLRASTTLTEEDPSKTLKDILSNYKTKKGWTSPSDSEVIKSLKELEAGLSENTLTEEELHRELLRRTIYYAQMPSTTANTVHERERVGFSNLPTKTLEARFLLYYQRGYFSKSTHEALAQLKKSVESRCKKTTEPKECKGSSRTAKSRFCASLAPTRNSTHESMLTAFGNGDSDALDAKQEYLLFGENYSILLRLKRHNPTLNDAQVKVYQDILLSTITEEGIDPVLKSTVQAEKDAYLFKVFEFSEEEQKKVQHSRKQLAQTYPGLLKEELLLEKEAIVLVIRKMVEYKGTEKSILLADSRLDSMLALPLFQSEASNASLEEIDPIPRSPSFFAANNASKSANRLNKQEEGNTAATKSMCSIS